MVEHGARRAGEEDDAYASLSDQAHQAGLRLRAVQQAQRLDQAHGAAMAASLEGGREWEEEEDRPNDPRELMRRWIHAQWPLVVNASGGFREGDETLPPEDPFRAQVTKEWVTLRAGRHTVMEGGPEGAARSGLEAVAWNDLVRTVREAIHRRREAVETVSFGAKVEYGLEKMIQRILGPLMQFEGFDPDHEAAEIQRSAQAEGIDPTYFQHLVRAVGTFFKDGMQEVLEQIEKEEKSRVDTPDGQVRLLDSALLNRALHLFSTRFIAGDTLEEVFENKAVQRLLDDGIEVTVAYEAESTFDDGVATRNLQAFHAALGTLGDREEANREKSLTKFMSMKLSALKFFDQDPDADDVHTLPPARIEPLKGALRELLDKAMQKGVFIRIDMEYFIHKDATFKIFKELLEENPNYANHLGLVVQAYLKDSPQDAEAMVAWAHEFSARNEGKRVSLRLVKGANIVRDKAHGQKGLHGTLGPSETTWHGQSRRALEATGEDAWHLTPQAPNDPHAHPIAKDLETTQRQYLEIARLFEQHRDVLDVAYGTMNPDTMAHLIARWLNLGEDLNERQIQTLFGMYNSLSQALRGVVSQRRYVPYGVIGKILAYMARRFVELNNASNGTNMPIMRLETGYGANPTRWVDPTKAQSDFYS